VDGHKQAHACGSLNGGSRLRTPWDASKVRCRTVDRAARHGEGDGGSVVVVSSRVGVEEVAVLLLLLLHGHGGALWQKRSEGDEAAPARDTGLSAWAWLHLTLFGGSRLPAYGIRDDLGRLFKYSLLRKNQFLKFMPVKFFKI